MLLFIGRGLHGDCLVFEFQNILCYCLSVAKSVHEPPFLKFQNILCYCLSYIRFIQKELIYISKHLMLLFIPRISAFFSFSPPLFPLIFSIFLHFLPANTLILNRPTYHPINLLIFQAFLDFSFFFRLVKIL